jgi:glutamate N-acetyltransferase / amino-acid N-acetyltransferase
MKKTTPTETGWNGRLLGREDWTLPLGYRAAGVAAGIKRDGARDMMLLVSEPPATTAAVFTTNQVQAAPVRLDRAALLANGGRARAIVVNSGNANACNGTRGMRDARRMAALTAAALETPEGGVMVCSTGTIGLPLPMALIEAGIAALPAALSADGLEQASAAILTTDTRPKRWTVELRVAGRPVRVTGFCKGAGMIEPNMATMLAFVTTDAAVPRAALDRLWRDAVGRSFNRISVDGDRSTNDSAFLLANGAAGVRLAPGRPGWTAFAEAVREVAHQLALMIVRDGEGATRFITIRVEGARSAADADLAARAVANSMLVKTAWAGPNANWGRVMDALGYSRARVDPDRVDLWFDERWAVRRGAGTRVTREDLKAVIARPAFTVRIRLGLGRGAAVVYTCNCTEDYVRINM